RSGSSSARRTSPPADARAGAPRFPPGGPGCARAPERRGRRGIRSTTGREGKEPAQERTAPRRRPSRKAPSPPTVLLHASWFPLFPFTPLSYFQTRFFTFVPVVYPPKPLPFR